MLAALSSIRREERRNAWAAFSMLFGLIGSHMVLETARDALFLASLPPSRLPVVYIGIALVSLLVTQIQLRVAGNLNRRRALSLWTAIASGVTLFFWAFLDHLGDVGFYALYIWSGVLTTLVLVHFWVLLSGIFTVTQAKRIYGMIGTGSVLGAIVGSALAGMLSSIIGASNLLLLSAGGFLLTSSVPYFLEDVGTTKSSSKAAEVDQKFADAARYIVSHPYTRAISILVLITTASVTLADYIFKATVAEQVAPEALGSFFAWVYFATNVVSLLAQIWLVNYLLKRFDIAIALSVLPFLLVLGGLGMLALPGLVAALLLKGADGSLRHSLHRTAYELLFLPLTDHVRARVKAFVDIVGQRGGQALVSLLILALGLLGVTLPILAGLLALLSLGWIACVILVRRHYLDLFRGRLRREDGFSDFPELDMASLETLITVLDSDNDDEVVAALDVLEGEGKTRLVPGFILYHPSEKVVDRALALLVRAGRSNVVPLVRRLLSHSSESIRAAAVATLSTLAFDEQELRSMLSHEESAAVRATIMVNLIASRSIVGMDAQATLEAIIVHGRPDEKIALAQAIARRNAPDFNDTVRRLAEDGDVAVRLAIVHAFGPLVNPDLLPVLLKLLAYENTLTTSQSALVRYGRPGLDFLLEKLGDGSVEPLARWQIPSTLVMFDAPEITASELLSRLVDESDGMLRYRMILALEDILDDYPTIELDRKLLDHAIARNTSRAYRCLDRRIALRRGAVAAPERATDVHALIASALRDKETHAIDRVLRLLGLAYRQENFDEIRDGLNSGEIGSRVSAIELIENIVAPPLRGAIAGLVEDADDEVRMAHASPYHIEQQLDYKALLSQLINETASIAIRALAIYHAGELRLSELAPTLQAIQARCAENAVIQVLCADIELALQQIRGNVQSSGADAIDRAINPEGEPG
jgi:AAA family ATP:ADP antiporter